MEKLIFDCETTSANRDNARITQLAIKIIDKDGKIILNKAKLYNPQVPIEPSASEITGITDEMVKNCPTFAEDAKKLKKLFENKIIIGYNILVFDIVVILNEFERAGVEVNLSRNFIDVLKIERILHSNTLSSVYERYTGKSLDNAHDAMIDVLATETVLEYQLKQAKKNGLVLEEVLEQGNISPDAADFFGKLKYNENKELCYTFGKHKGLAVNLNTDTKQYANWILGDSQNFPSQVKQLLKDELKKGTKKEFTHPASFKPIQSFDDSQKSFFFSDSYKKGRIEDTLF